MTNSKQYDGLVERIYWLIKLRWIAIVGVIVTILFVKNIVSFSLPFFSLFGVVVFLTLYNLIFFLYLARLKKNNLSQRIKIASRIANIQITLDLLSLVTLIHFSGGIENPFIFYFIFHMIIASILLTKKASYLQATLAIILFSLFVGLEYFKVVPHYCLESFTGTHLGGNGRYILAVLFVFATTLYLSVYMASSISERLRRRTDELMVANEKLLEQDRLKNEYVHRVTHNIKAHLSSIESCLAPIADEITGQINPTQKDLISRARSRTDKLLFFVKALLKLTQIRLAKDWPLEDISLRDIAKRSIETVDPKAKAKNITITLDAPVDLANIKANEMGAEEVFVDLLMNSLKYTPEGGKVDLKISESEDYVLVEIKDTGIGISKEDMPRLFEEFFRADNAREVERDGTGLGLSIVKQIIQRHKGKVWAESAGLGKGTKFTLLLPK